ncbi:hypothetical protein [Pseudofrankia inefficax]|uniref:hypothetical protein n=1 Tax=Pseudofrankia inefficax (strain DSM 45817 / CECT 9037 / DDB 130130 / EuI1c) TaxID=298654 RepID=UPI000321907C|nr:hypothetical protein [Pseudofrankia inefficax]
MPAATTFRTPSKGDAYDFSVRVRCSWRDGNRKINAVRRGAGGHDDLVREQIAVTVRCVLRNFPPHQAAEAESAVNRELARLAEAFLPGTTLRWSARAQVGLDDAVREIQQKAWAGILEQAAADERRGAAQLAAHDLTMKAHDQDMREWDGRTERTKRYIKGFDESVRDWFRVLSALGVTDLLREDNARDRLRDVPPPFLVPALARLAVEPTDADKVIKDLAARRDAKDRELFRTVSTAIQNVESIDVNLLDFEDAQNSALVRLMQWAGLRVPGSARLTEDVS